MLERLSEEDIVNKLDYVLKMRFVEFKIKTKRKNPNQIFDDDI